MPSTQACTEARQVLGGSPLSIPHSRKPRMNELHDAQPQAERREDPVLLDIADGLATITLNRPGRNNGINAVWAEHLSRFVEQIATTPDLRVLLIRGNGPRFCVGADLDWLRLGEAGAASRINRILLDLNSSLMTLRSLPLIVVAAVHGAAAGGGFGLMNAADLVIASSDTQFTSAYTRIGGTPDCSLSYVLPRIVGERRALEMMLLPELFDAATAQRLGVVNFVVLKDSFDAEVAKLVKRLLDGPSQAYAAVKRLTYASLSASLADQLDAERRAMVAMSAWRDFQEGVSAFVEKRAPRFGKLE
jgi:2-(1,2-epoxy-1,2-dihydrophenyl)acetyl-CoA isomerase